MEIIPFKTKVFVPPQDDIYPELDRLCGVLKEEDVIIVTSKIVSIHEGRSVPIEDADRMALIKEEAEHFLGSEDEQWPLTISHRACMLVSGVDESNSNGYYTLLPERPFESAKKIYDHLIAKTGYTKLGVIITDSYPLPFRNGTMSISIGFWGMRPVFSNIGNKDLFGREMSVSPTNMVDALAAASTLESGEAAECHPLVIIRDVPNIAFTPEDTREELAIDSEDDIYTTLFKDRL